MGARLLSILFLVFFNTTVSAQQTLMPYAGIDLQQRNMALQKGYGYNVFSRKYLQNNFYMGLKLNKNFGLEGGYQSSQNSSKKSMVLLGEDLLGERVDNVGTLGAEGFVVTETSIRTKGPHLNIMGFLPLENGKTEFVASVGITALTINADYKQLADSFLLAYSPAFVAETVRQFSSTRMIPRCMLGLQRKFSDSLGFRASFIYELTSRFKQVPFKNTLNESNDLLPGNGDLRASLRNSITYGLGVFMTF
jgi:hypothetical protein